MLLASLFFLSFFCLAQVTEEWVARYNGPANDDDRSFSLVVDDSKNVYVTGRSTGIGTETDYATIKYKESGTPLWEARYNGPGNGIDDASSIAVDKEGNVYVTGGSTGKGTGRDYATIKYNSAGVLQWVVRYNGTGSSNDMASSIALDKEGNVYVTGRSIGAGTGVDYATIKYNSAGVRQWVRRYNGPANSYDNANSIAVDGSGNVYVTGESAAIASTLDYATVKYNAAGVVQWVRRYNGPGNSEDHASSLALDASANVYVTGYSGGIGSNDDYATIKYNSAGVRQWVRRYNGPGNRADFARSMALDAGGNVYVSGGSAGIGSGYDYATIKYNSSGVQQWVVRYNGPGNDNDQATSLALDASANVYVTGLSQSVGSSFVSHDIVSIKYTTAGTNLWLIRYDGPAKAFDQGTCIAVDVSANVYVTGFSEGIGTVSDYATIKYSQPPPIAPRPAPVTLTTDFPSRFRVSNYPNPVSSITRIQYEIPFDGRVAIKLYDILGREVATLFNADKKAGYYNTEFDVSSLQKGVYYYKVSLQERENIITQSGKMIVIK